MPEKETNAKGGEECCDETYPDDGRVTFDNPNNHKRDWGKHLNDKDQDDRKKKQ